MAVGEYACRGRGSFCVAEPGRELIDITSHVNGENEILFLKDDNMVYKGDTIASIRLELTSSQLVAEFI